VEQLSELYNQKKLKLQKILDLTLQQAETIKNQDIDKLTQLLNARQLVMDEVDQTDRQINLAQEQLSEPFANKEQPAALQAEINHLLKQIIAQDEENKANLDREFMNVKQKLKDLTGSKAMRQAYGPAQQPQRFGYFIDKKK